MRSGDKVCLTEGVRSTFKNIAENKFATSSSVYADYAVYHSPVRLTDGERRAIRPYCAATKQQSQPWMRIDLNNIYQIDHVLVFHGWSWGESCDTYEVRVGATATWNEMTSCGEGSQLQNETIVCIDCLLGRYIQLQLKSKNNQCLIVLCEIEVFAAVV
ncbi:uncharacterized protein LOC133178451 [Saccostrea echinata]|uniref:uncharacterized protein LOC133178451 n=1 Tax=Saccostrea echinata TaxID=191078 RepID=UPI002A82EB73|nr:uncharacterized protein LOC133178451 [Saccostrea echinata]